MDKVNNLEPISTGIAIAGAIFDYAKKRKEKKEYLNSIAKSNVKYQTELFKFQLEDLKQATILYNSVNKDIIEKSNNIFLKLPF